MFEEEREEKVKMIKQGGTEKLMVLNSFEKQSAQIQFIEHMSKYYNNQKQKENVQSKPDNGSDLDVHSDDD